jgi:hypothetical protein
VKKKKNKKNPSQVLVAHACNPSFSGDRDQETLGAKPVQANSLQDPILKNPSQKRAGKKKIDKQMSFDVSQVPAAHACNPSYVEG